MSKTASTLSIVIALIVGVIVGKFAFSMSGPPTQDGNPIGFHVTGNVSPQGAQPAVAALTNCVNHKNCTISIDLQLPKSAPMANTPAPCAANSTCLQFTGSTQVNSTDWNGQKHPAAGFPPEALKNSSGTIAISDIK